MNKIGHSCSNSDERYCDVQQVNTEKLVHLLKSGSVDMCEDVIRSFFEEIGFFGIKSLLMRLYVAMDIYIVIRGFAKDLGILNEDFVNRYGSIDDIETNLMDEEGAVKFFSDMLEQCIRWRVEFCHETANEPLHCALEYIGRNYMRDDISLKSVSSAVNLTPTYFSSLFKKEIGMNFSEYLTNLRVEKAKELLCCTSKLISEISYEVGFADYRYFGQIFKKNTGYTPRDFQNINNRLAQKTTGK